MRARTLQSSFTTAGGTVTVDYGIHGLHTYTAAAGTEYATVDALCAAIGVAFGADMSVGLGLVTAGCVSWTDATGWVWSLIISEAAMAAYLGTPTSLVGQAGSSTYTGAVCPGWWSGYVRRDWQYEYGVEYPSLHTHQGGQRLSGMQRTGDIILWASIAALTEIEQLYRCLYYSLDRRELTDDLSRVFVVGDTNQLQAVIQAFPMSDLRVPLIRVEATVGIGMGGP